MFETLRNKLKDNNAVVCVIGTGYVGLPLVLGFAESGLKTIGFDTSKEKTEQLNSGNDVTGEIGSKRLSECREKYGIEFTNDHGRISDADFVIICVPTPIRDNKEPDLSFIKGAGNIIGGKLKKGCIVILESTVYPGVTEDVLKPVLERESGMLCGRDFCLGYSPERVNPGDAEHSLRDVVKIVSGTNPETTDILDSLYSRIVNAGVFKARDIRTAEAAKVIENIQRDLNIALVNELSIIFGKMDIDIMDVLKAAETKWNFHAYKPGFVGGHCIPVDPYYLVFRSKQLGYDPKVILTGREINNFMPRHVADKALEKLRKAGKDLEKSHILLLGLTFKKNVRDTRNAPVKGIITALKESKVRISAYEPLLEKEMIKDVFGVESADRLDELSDIDCTITVTDHDVFEKHVSIDVLKEISNPGAIIVDARRMFDPENAKKSGFVYMT